MEPTAVLMHHRVFNSANLMNNSDNYKVFHGLIESPKFNNKTSCLKNVKKFHVFPKFTCYNFQHSLPFSFKKSSPDCIKSTPHLVHSQPSGSESVPIEEIRITDNYGGGNDGDGDGGDRNNGGSGRGDGGGGGGEGGDDETFGPNLNAQEVESIIIQEGIQLPDDMLLYAKSSGLPSLLLERYIELKKSSWPIGPAMDLSSAFRNRMLADPAFLFKVATEVAIDCFCTTIAETQERGKEFWNEFHFYASNVVVAIAVDIALVGMLAPVARFSSLPSLLSPSPSSLSPSSLKGLHSRFSKFLSSLPSSVFEQSLPGQRFSIGQRAASYFVKTGEYGAVGFACGLVGQSIANACMMLQRQVKKPEDKNQLKIPGLIETATLWAVFMAVSSNTRYQIINGLEQALERSVLARSLPLLSRSFTIGIRFGNNVFGGYQFVQWARSSGVQ